MQTWNCHEETYAYRFPESGGMAHHAGTHRDTPGQVRRQRELGDSLGNSLSCGFHKKDGLTEQGS